MDKSQNEGKITLALLKISGSITGLAEKTEHIKGRMPERLAVGLYLVGHILMIFVHEPWFDEALAWLIARDSSLYEILFVAPHYEGHPSLWHLVLMPFAKLGAPYELSLNLVSLIFSGIAMVLFIYKAPFKRIIRLLIPFTYFTFYQYSVISRPYSMMMLAFVLAAMAYKRRNDMPGRFVLTLLFLCMTSAYGLVISGGICVAWLIKILCSPIENLTALSINHKEKKKRIPIIIKERLVYKGTIFWLLGLLGYAIFLIIRIIPVENTYAIVRNTGETQNNLISRVLYSFFGILSDCFVTNSFCDNDTFRNSSISTYELIICICIGICIMMRLIYKSYKKKMLLEFLIPFTFLALFTSFVYLFVTHIGVVFLFIGFCLWILDTGVKADGSHPGFIIFKAFSIFILLYWSISSSLCDCFYDYGCGRNEYMFLKDNNLEGHSVLAEWMVLKSDVDKVTNKYDENMLLLSNECVSIAPYLDNDNLLLSPRNLGLKYTNVHEMITKSDIKKIRSLIYGLESPDILLGIPELGWLYPEKSISIADYIRVYKKAHGVIIKGVPTLENAYIYVKRDLAEKLKLKEIS